MKKTTFIIIGIVGVLLLLLTWVYLLIYGTPSSVNEVFTDFGLLGTTTEPTPTESLPIFEEEPVVDVKTEKLRQLTTRPVIGFREYQATTTEPRFIMYAEAGTGHIYEINLETGEEVRISNTTIPNAEQAVFSPNKKYVALRSGYGNQGEVVLLTITTTGSGEAVTLLPRMTNFTFSDSNELLYTELTNAGTAGKILTPSTKATRPLFTVPFQAVTVAWSPSANVPHYVYPKTTSKLTGYLYAILNGSIVRQPIAGTGLMAEASSRYIIGTELVGTEPQSFVYDLTSKERGPAGVTFEPSKCAFSPKAAAVVYCGYELTEYSYNYPDDWYKGTRNFTDRIWRLNVQDGSASQIANPEQLVGRTIDITNMDTGIDGRMLYFMNKNDNTLWLYEI